MNYHPKDPKIDNIWQRLSPAVREQRFAVATHHLELIQQFKNRCQDVSERSAAEQLDTKVNRTTLRRWHERYEQYGFDGLIDIRIGPYQPMDKFVADVICTLRRANPDISIEDIIAHLKKNHDVTIGATSVKRVLRENKLNRPRGVAPGTKREFVGRKLAFGGMKLLEAAIVETGYLELLSEGIVAHVSNLPRFKTLRVQDTSGRDSNGRFQSEYNERNRKGPEDSIGPAFASVVQKREKMDVDRMKIDRAKPEAIQSKLLALMASPLVGGGRWDGMRTQPSGILLGEICDHPYMPATLDRFTRELKYAGVAGTLWEVHARFALRQSQRWGEGDKLRNTVLYIDGTTKPIWTNMFCQATKISSVGRTMPGLEVVAFHSGYGVPLWMLTYSGRAPLVNIVPETIGRLEEICGSSSIGRVVVIDAEANSIPFLKSLENGTPSRGWVTRLRDEWIKAKNIFRRNNYRAYRNGDRVRMGIADFNDPEVKGGKFRMRVVEVERRTSGRVTYLGASMLLDTREWMTAAIADLYFNRWPNQEADFRAVNQAAGFKDVHGYGKQLVDNISVVTGLDDLVRKSHAAKERCTRQKAALDVCEQKFHKEKKQVNRLIRRQETVSRLLKSEVVVGQNVTVSVKHLVEEQGSLITEIAKRMKHLENLQVTCDDAKSRLDRTKERLETYSKQQKTLESRRRIFAHDVELDSLFSLLKVGLVLMVAYVLREYFGNAAMDALTFLERIATLSARQSFARDYEIITFEYNYRDPDVMALIGKYAQAVNERGLRLRNGKKLRIIVDPAPPPLRATPPRKDRCNSKCRFER